MENKPVKKSRFFNTTMFALVVALFYWAIRIIHGKAQDEASWLLLPLTGIYVVVNIYIARASLLSAEAAAQSASISSAVLQQLNLSTAVMYAPGISFPRGYKYFVNDDVAMICLTNLFNQPAFSLQIMLWGLEVNENGETGCKFSTLHESTPLDFPGDAKEEIFTLFPSRRTDAEKIQFGTEAMQRFESALQRKPNYSLCILIYHTKVSDGPVILVYDLEVQYLQINDSDAP